MEDMKPSERPVKMLMPPPFEVNHSCKLKCVYFAIASVFALATVNAETLELNGDGCYTVHGHETYDELRANVPDATPWGDHKRIWANNSQLTITGKTEAILTAPLGSNPSGGTMFFKSQGETGLIELKGDVYAVSQHQGENQLPEGGSNLFYAVDGGTIRLGSQGTKTYAASIAAKPDVLSAKSGGKIYLDSTHNQIIGSMDFVDLSFGRQGSLIKGVFSGEDSFWFGDEQSIQNSNFKDVFVGVTDSLDLTFENGAQWVYFGIADRHSIFTSIPKRVSEITLRNGGIINLFDENIQEYWQDIGLDKTFPEVMDVKHDYVVIGNLKGSGGIFRLDLNSDSRTDSDVIYVEGSTSPGVHHIEPYNLGELNSISPENELIFAIVAKDAKVTFADKQNIYGETLFDYELQVASEEFANPGEIEDAEELQGKYGMDGFDEGGTKWVITDLILSDSTAVRGMTGAGWASYGAAVEMDRHDRRLSETSRNQEDPNNGLWIRATHGRAGAAGQYRWDRDGFTLGVDRKISEGNRLGMWFSYSKGNTELLDVDDGNGDMERYELALYDTLTFGSHYLDFVGRFGRVSSEFSTVNPKYSTSGDYDQDYLALSAEYGYTLKDVNTGVFIEPQVQAQVAWLDSYDYSVQRTMSTDVDSATSVIGRIGLRAGRAWSGETCAGEIYIRGDVLHQLTDGQDVMFKSKTDVLHRDWGDFGTWATFGIGGFATWRNCLDFQFDVEKTEGSEIDDTWLLSGRMNYRF